MFAYCRNNPASRIDISGTADEVCYNNNGEIFVNNDLTGLDGGGGMKSTYVSGVTNHSNGGNGTGSMIGDIAYIDAKAAATTYIPTWGWEEVFAFISSLFSGQSSNHSQCFVEGTLVQTAEGTTAIENIEVGDYVWAWDEESGDVALKEVVETYVNQTCELIHVFVNGEEIVTTPEHPFYSPVKGWTTAVHLRAGDILVLVNGEYVVVEKIQHEILESPVKVYNFQVDGYHTYYVANAGVLVHNDCAHKNTTTEWDIKTYSQGEVHTSYNGKPMIAHYDGRYYWLADKAKHGGSYYKVFVKSGKYLFWYTDADAYGNFIFGKHKSDTGKVLKIG